MTVIQKIPLDVSEKEGSLYKPCKLLLGPYHGDYHVDKGFSWDRFFPHVQSRLVEWQRGLEKTMGDWKRSIYPDFDFESEGISCKMFRDRLLADAWNLVVILTSIADRESLVNYVSRISNTSYGKLVLQIEFNPEHVKLYKRDMLLYTNQIPFVVIWALLSTPRVFFLVFKVDDPTQLFIDELCKVFSLQVPPYNLSKKCLHILDFYRCAFLYGGLTNRNVSKRINIGERDDDDNFLIPSATELVEAGIGIKIKKSWLMDITLTRNNFDIPRLDLPNTDMEFVTHNIILFERSDLSAGTQFSSYIYFMDKLIQNDDDVKLLRFLGIINPTLHGDKVVELIRRVSKNIEFNDKWQMDAELFNTGKMLRKRYNKNCEPWRKDLFQNYLSTPWAVISIFGAFLILSLTVIQTVYTILGYYKK